MIGYLAGSLGLVILMGAVALVQLGFVLTLALLAIVFATLIAIVVALITIGRGIFYDRRKSEADI